MDARSDDSARDSVEAMMEKCLKHPLAIVTVVILLQVFVCGCTPHTRGFDVAALNVGREELTEVAVLSGEMDVTFDVLIPGANAEWSRPPLNPAEPWTLVWRDSAQKLHVVPLQIDAGQVPDNGTVILEIWSPNIRIVYEERITSRE
jgi:hypothetical protein